MEEPYNGIAAPALGPLAWLKSQHSNPSGNCVEVACLPTGEIAVRNSRHPSGPVLLYTRAEMAAFLQGAKDGEFDRLLALDPCHADDPAAVSTETPTDRDAERGRGTRPGPARRGPAAGHPGSSTGRRFWLTQQ
jgi:hypothetical protein